MANLNGVEIPDRVWDSLSPDQKQYFTNNPEYVQGFYKNGEITGIGSKGDAYPHWAWQTESDLAAIRAEAAQRKQNGFEVSPSIPLQQVEPTPLTPSLMPTTNINVTPVASSIPVPPAKTAPIDTVLFNDDSVPIEVMTDLIFENIGGQELINIARNDIINGQKISYSPIKNLTSIQQQYNPNNIVSLQSTSDKYFANFSIKLDQKVPNIGNGPNGSNVYIEQSTGDLIIETVNIENDEQVDIQIAISGTIYEADI
jgi:hypothetical protein